MVAVTQISQPVAVLRESLTTLRWIIRSEASDVGVEGGLGDPPTPADRDGGDLPCTDEFVDGGSGQAEAFGRFFDRVQQAGARRWRRLLHGTRGGEGLTPLGEVGGDPGKDRGVVYGVVVHHARFMRGEVDQPVRCCAGPVRKCTTSPSVPDSAVSMINGTATDQGFWR